MIGIIDVEIQAHNPSLPLYPMVAYLNSPSSIRVRNVPKKIGNWNITSVSIVAAYPDNSIQTASCVLVGGVWVGTIAGCAVPGKSENGFTVFASGTDENGNQVNNYVLGKGLIEILEADGTITPGTPTYYVHLLSSQPTSPKEGDMWPDNDGEYTIYQNGVANVITERVEALADEANKTALQAYWIADSAQNNVNNITVLIPAQATLSNQLADKAFVNSSVQTATANFRGNWTTWADVPTVSSDYPADYAGSKTPTVNDYLVVQDASGYVGQTLVGTWRFKYSGEWATDGKSGWLPEYQVNETPMTSAQLAAINSNITAAKVRLYDSYRAQFHYDFYVPPTETGYDCELPSNAYPIVYVVDGVTHTINDASGIYFQEVGGGMQTIYDASTSLDLGVFSAEGQWYGSFTTESITFGGSSYTTLTITSFSQYALHDRAINTLSIDNTLSTYNLGLPTRLYLQPNQARDFVVRVIAAHGTYSTPPQLSVHGATLMNADGAMPEIKTDTTDDCTTLVYFSEIALNVFLVKGESLEEITT